MRGDWKEYWNHEPWGEKRADWRQLANTLTWGRIIGGGDGEVPNAMWPYFKSDVDPAELLAEIENADAELEPKEGGGYQWKVKRGDDNRQT